MPHFIQMKKQLKADILEAVDKAEKLDLSKTIAAFSLNTGFTEKTITKVLKQMHELSYIEIDGNIIKRPSAPSQQGVQ